MGTFFKYLIYLLVIIALYIVVKGCYDGTINSQTSVGDVASQVTQGTKNIAEDAANAIDKAADEVTQTRQGQ